MPLYWLLNFRFLNADSYCSDQLLCKLLYVQAFAIDHNRSSVSIDADRCQSISINQLPSIDFWQSMTNRVNQAQVKRLQTLYRLPKYTIRINVNWWKSMWINPMSSITIDNHKLSPHRLSIGYRYQSINCYRLISINIVSHRSSVSSIANA